MSPVKTYSLFSRTPVLEKQIDAKQRVLKEKKVKRQENRSKKSNVWTCQDRDGLKWAVWGEGMGRGEGRGGREGDPARSPHLSVPDLLSHRSASFPDTVLKQPYL